jgi:2-deoxy-D-gluconate 3-dehydrogenase
MNSPPPGDVASFSLHGKVALITGATRGIGRGIALAMAKAGAEVVISGRDEANAKKVLAEVEGLGGKGGYIISDLKKEEDVDGLVPQTVEKFGKIDILVNNAGIGPDYWAIDCTVEQWREVQRFDLEVPFRLSQAAARFYFEHGKGVIINISSIMGITTQPGEGAYVAAKHGMHGLTKILALEWAARGVRVNAIAPGLILTDMTSHLAGEALARRVRTRYPANRPGYPIDIGGVAVFLASDAADFIHGQVIVVDGGRTIGSPDQAALDSPDYTPVT